MIALTDGMPLVQLEGGRVVAFQPHWVARGLIRAAAQAGYQNWWPAGHVTETLTQYLRAHHEGNTVTAEHLERLLCDALQAVGYGEIAPFVKLGHPAECLNLMEVLREAGEGYELLFFYRLRDRLRDIIRTGTTEVDLVGLTPCVKKLRTRKNWTRACDALCEEIVSFVRTQAFAAPGKRNISVQVR